MSGVEGEEVGDTIANRDVETPDVVPGGDPKESSPVVANEDVVASAPQKEAENPTPPPTTDSPDAPAEHEGTGSPEPLLASPKDEEEEEDNVATVVVNLSSTEQLDEEEPEKQPRKEEKSSNNIPAKEEPVVAEEKFEGKGYVMNKGM